MFNRLLILSLMFLSIQTLCFAQTDLKMEVAKQVERIKSLKGSSSMGFGELPYAPEVNFLPKDNPIKVLIDMGMDAVPPLLPHIADNSLTQAYKRHGSGWREQATVSEYIIFVIWRITDHTFAGKYPDKKLDVEDYQDQALAWWKKNHSKSLSERKLKEVNDPIHTNRFSAYEYLGKTKQGRELLEKRIEMILPESNSSLIRSELTSCAEALGKIGDIESAKSVRKVSEQLSYWIKNHPDTYLFTNKFKVLKVLALLGFKEEAWSGLRELKEKYINKMGGFTQKDFFRVLQEVENL